jgi:hypothetical protein
MLRCVLRCGESRNPLAENSGEMADTAISRWLPWMHTSKRWGSDELIYQRFQDSLSDSISVVHFVCVSPSTLTPHFAAPTAAKLAMP